MKKTLILAMLMFAGTAPAGESPKYKPITTTYEPHGSMTVIEWTPPDNPDIRCSFAIGKYSNRAGYACYPIKQ